MEIYYGLFGTNATVQKYLHKAMVDLMPKGATLGAGTQLISGDGGVYLLSNGVKRHIHEPATMAKYRFDWGSAHDIGAEVSKYPTGPEIV
jgi:hypothetical protein